MAKKITTTTPEVEQATGYPKLVDRRLSQIYFSLEEQKAECLVVNYLPNVRYLTNFSGSEGMLFITPDEMHFVTDDRYEEQIKTELYPLPNLKTHISRDVWKYAPESDVLSKIKDLAFEADRISYAEAVSIRNQIRPIKFKPAPYIVEPFTVPKAPEELANIRKACEIAEKVYEYMLGVIKPGISEKEIEIEIAHQSRIMGSENDPFDIIVTSGNRGALVHGQATDRKIKSGDIVIMDFGCKVNGFISDITRTVAVGKATKQQKEIYQMLWKAKEIAINNVRPGMNGKHLDKLSRDIIKAEGYGDYFQHSLGHGIGLVPHEKPIITFRKDDQIVPEDCALAIEPGVYLPDKFGMRIEDNIHVTKNGGVRLTNSPEELPII